MLLPSTTSKTPSVELLINLWAERYTVDVSSLSKNPRFYGELMKAAAPEARALTAAKLLKNVLERTINQIDIQAKLLYEYIPQIIDIGLGQQITQLARQVYQKLLEVYQQQSGIIINPVAKKMAIGDATEQTYLSLATIPNIENLATEIEQLLLKYQDQHIIANDWRVLGFLTTLFNFTNKLLINQLTSVEKVLLCPYFKFVEEQVAIPFQRVCTAAANHQLSSASLMIVEQMFPVAAEISSTVYFQLLQLFPHHRSLRGGLSHPEVAHSCLRDLDMFQAYLWLSLLEGNLKPIEQELVPLCVMVMPSVGVSWEMIDRWRRILVEEIESRLQPEHQPVLLNYTQGMEAAFFEERKRLGHQDGIMKIPANLAIAMSQANNI